MHETNQFAKYIEEMHWRSKWVSNNLEKLEHYVGDSWHTLRIDQEQPITVLPLIVTNTVINVEKTGCPPVITHNELSELLSSNLFAKQKIETNSLFYKIGCKNINLVFQTVFRKPI